jgi:hypothetical protein
MPQVLKLQSLTSPNVALDPANMFASSISTICPTHVAEDSGERAFHME